MKESALYYLTYGLFVLTAREGERDNGCIINTAIQVTNAPDRVAVVVNKQNFTHDMIMQTGEFNLSILTKKSKFETFRHWGYQSGKDTDKAQGINFARGANQIIYLLDEVNAYLSGRVVSVIDLGTHTLFLAEITEQKVLSREESVTYDYYQKKIKPEPDGKRKKGYICMVCGFIYEGDYLPEDYICPVCKHPAEDFRAL